jgi:hypothetical protein
VFDVRIPQDTFRAVWGWQILFAPERIPGMVQSMLQDYEEVRTLGGFLELTLNVTTGRMAPYVEEYCRFVAFYVWPRSPLNTGC